MQNTEQLEFATTLYREYSSDLASVIEQQRAFLAVNRERMTPQLDDIEAELTYLYLRALRPATVMELGTFHGWSTSWILSALRDNGTGTLHSFDRIDNVVHNVPAPLADHRWSFVRGDVRKALDAVPRDAGFLFVDAAHSRRFGRWYLAHLFPLLPSGTPVSVHDVFHGKQPRIHSEGREVLSWLDERGVASFTAARRRAPEVYATINALRTELGIEGVRGAGVNPMIWFNLP